ncbi:MAG: 4-amino-4-deoxy-L-arabinose-phospho-UDP flippase [Gammaproteobacteria bacterium]|jgi:undecaprenyl phosphate-alpha-L-ara4N flippase subunit ArnF|nr:4-amino-4-deoxy-L-arabinose-phospho-UDP flippase [Gammaproteobacteria bacterium]MCW8941765.1 4-amino-4-deoxy-L-arabinose-phospho-UDP flippase [Gammaproteobacteria bacterium]
MHKIRSSAVILLALTIILSACAQLFMKVSMIQLQQLLDGTADKQSLLSVMLDNRVVIAWLFAGLLCYALSMLSWIFALIKYELSFAYPFLGVTYVLVYLGAVYWEQIGEQLTLLRTVGIVLILIGVVFVNYKNNNDQEKTL